MNASSHHCPDCGGAGIHVCYACPGFVRTVVGCRTCSGKGHLSAEVLARWEKGRAMAADRISRDTSLREEARRLGISPKDLSDLEHGRVPGGNP